MIWGSFSAFGSSELRFITTRMNSEGYQEVLEERLLPYMERFRSAKLIFQQDNATYHASKSTKEWLERHNVAVMKWPACSPDLNPIENLWGILVRKVYADCRHYDTEKELKNSILHAWKGIEKMF